MELSYLSDKQQELLRGGISGKVLEGDMPSSPSEGKSRLGFCEEPGGAALCILGIEDLALILDKDESVLVIDPCAQIPKHNGHFEGCLEQRVLSVGTEKRKAEERT